MKIQMRIEAMRREFDFISKLDTGDVGYVLQKKREQAAIAIQRNFRMQKAKRELRDRRAGLYKKVDDEELLMTAYDLEKVKEHKEELRQQRNYINE
jgi:threonine synthase